MRLDDLVVQLRRVAARDDVPPWGKGYAAALADRLEREGLDDLRDAEARAFRASEQLDRLAARCGRLEARAERAEHARGELENRLERVREAAGRC